MQPDQQLILDAARRGDWEPANRAELQVLQLTLRPIHPDGSEYSFLKRASNGSLLLPTAIVRHAGPRCETLVEWHIVTACGRCWRTLSRRRGCRKCLGLGYVGIDAENVDPWLVTTLDGIVVGESED